MKAVVTIPSPEPRGYEYPHSAQLDEALHQITLAITSTFDFDEIMARTIRVARKAIGTEGAAILLREGERYVVRFVDGVPKRAVGVSFVDSDAEAFAEATLQGETIVILNARTDPRLRRNLAARFMVRSLISQPIMIGDRPIGVLVFTNHFRLREFSDKELSFCSRLSALLSVAIHNSHLFADERAAHSLADTLAEINLLLSSSNDPQAVMHQVIEIATRSSGAHGGMMALRVPDGWRIAYGSGFDSRLIGTLLSPYSAAAAEWCARTGVTIVVEDKRHDERLDSRAMDEIGARSFKIAQVKVKDAVIGIFALHYRDVHEFTDFEVNFASKLASSVSIAYENYQLRSSLESELARIAFLKEIATAVTGSLSIREVCDSTLELSKKYLGARTGSVYFIDQSARKVEHISIFGYADSLKSQMETLSLESDTNVIRVVKSGETMTHETTSQAEVSVRRYHEAGLDGHRWFIVPVRSKGALIGTFGLSFAGVRSFAESEMSLFVSVAEQLGIAIENARLHQEERNIAETLQEPLLKMPAQVEGLLFGHLYRSATTSTKVGGDFHDLYALSDDLILMLIGDVAGKGLLAANLITVIKSTVRAYARQGDRPAEIMKKANEMLISENVSPPFVTAFIALLNPSSGELVYCNAGHTLPLLRHVGDATSEFLLSGTVPIGIFQGVPYEEQLVVMEPNDRLVLYTDGIVEARTGGELYGEERLAEVVGRNDFIEVAELPGAIINDASTFSNGELHDDIAILVVALRAA